MMKHSLLRAAALLLAAVPIAAQTCPGDDLFEDNETCATARPVVPANYPNLVVHDNDEDLFLIRLLPYEELHVDISFDSARGDLSLYLDGANDTQCGLGAAGNHLRQSATSGDVESITYRNHGSPDLYVLHVAWANPATPGCNEYAMVVATAGSCPGNDPFEENDTCATASRIPRGTYLNLSSQSGEDDFYVVTVPDGDSITVDLVFRNGEADLDLGLLTADCLTTLDASLSTTDDEFVSHVNSSGMPQDYVIHVDRFLGAACANYVMAVAIGACGTRPDDHWEDNDDCSMAPFIGPSYTGELLLSHDDADFYRTVLQPDETLVVELTHHHPAGDIDLFLYESGDPTCGDPGAFSWITSSTSVTNNERFEWQNTTAQPLEYLIQPFWYGGAGCNSYELIVSIRPPMALGSIFCFAHPNSTGQGATLHAIGSDAVSDNGLRLLSERLPLDSFGYFLNSRWAGYLSPPASVGELCVNDGAVGRYNRPGEIRSSGSTGAVELALDLLDTPTPWGSVSIAPGEGWSFQYWYRDVAIGGGATSNLSEAVRVIFR